MITSNKQHLQEPKAAFSLPVGLYMPSATCTDKIAPNHLLISLDFSDQLFENLNISRYYK